MSEIFIELYLDEDVDDAPKEWYESQEKGLFISSFYLNIL